MEHSSLSEDLEKTRVVGSAKADAPTKELTLPFI